MSNNQDKPIIADTEPQEVDQTSVVKAPKQGLFVSLFPFLKKNKKTKDTIEVPASELSSQDSIKKFNQGLIDVKDLIAPAAIEVDFNHLAMGNKYFRTLFALGYPRFVGPNWLEPLINFDHALDISTFYYPVDSKDVMQKLRRKIAEMEATVNADLEAGKIVDQHVKVALADARELQEQLAKGTEKFFHFALYVTIHADTIKELEDISRSVESTLGAIGVIVKPATLQQDTGFESTIPACTDKLYVTRNMDTTSIATTFPFVSSELTMDQGIMYGINKHNKSLVVFDRFQLENANTVVFAKSGAGKSYMVKLEVLRSLMFGVESIIIDPEREYEKLADTIGGVYISFTQDGANKLNPFELTGLFSENEDELRSKIISLHGLIRIMVGGVLSSQEDATLDRALILTYKEKGITPDPATQVNEAPLLEDLYKVLTAMAENEAHDLASKLEKYVKGSAAGIFDKKSNIDIRNTFTVFSVRDLSEELRPIAMYMMLEFIWTRIRKDVKRRILVVDEAWWMMQYPDAARFLYSIAKRARKYYLGVTTITQDVEDFLDTDYGKAIVTNSSMQILLKQSPASVDRLQKVFYLSEGEKTYLLSSGVGEGLFFAGPNHVAIEVVSSLNEHRLLTSDPKDLERYEKERVQKSLTDDSLNIKDEALVVSTTINEIDNKDTNIVTSRQALDMMKPKVTVSLPEEKDVDAKRRQRIKEIGEDLQQSLDGSNIQDQLLDEDLALESKLTLPESPVAVTPAVSNDIPEDQKTVEVDPTDNVTKISDVDVASVSEMNLQELPEQATQDVTSSTPEDQQSIAFSPSDDVINIKDENSLQINQGNAVSSLLDETMEEATDDPDLQIDVQEDLDKSMSTEDSTPVTPVKAEPAITDNSIVDNDIDPSLLSSTNSDLDFVSDTPDKTIDSEVIDITTGPTAKTDMDDLSSISDGISKLAEDIQATETLKVQGTEYVDPVPIQSDYVNQDLEIDNTASQDLAKVKETISTAVDVLSENSSESDALSANDTDTNITSIDEQSEDKDADTLTISQILESNQSTTSQENDNKDFMVQIDKQPENTNPDAKAGDLVSDSDNLTINEVDPDADNVPQQPLHEIPANVVDDVMPNIGQGIMDGNSGKIDFAVSPQATTDVGRDPNADMELLRSAEEKLKMKQKEMDEQLRKEKLAQDDKKNKPGMSAISNPFRS